MSLLIILWNLMQTIPWWMWAGFVLVVGGALIVRRIPGKGIYAQETYIGIDSPIALHGRPDRVMWAGRYLRVEELKTRQRVAVYDSDVWQLSMYKYILRRVQPHPVLEEARVWVKVGERLVPKDVTLKSDAQVEALYARYQALRSGQVAPTLCTNRRYCQRCSHHQVRCFPPSQPVRSRA